MVIECPACHTKFFVDSSQLEDVEKPRFHCSRCDHFFGIPPPEERTQEPEAAESPTESPADTEEPNPEQEQLDLLPQPRSTRAQKRTIRVDRTELTYKIVNGKKVPLITADWPDLAEGEEHEADLSSALPESPTEAEETLESTEDQDSEVSEKRSSPGEALFGGDVDQSPGQGRGDLAEEAVTPSDVLGRRGRQTLDSDDEQQPSVLAQKPKLEEEIARPPIGFGQAPEARPVELADETVPEPEPATSSSFRSISLVCSLPLLLCLALWFIGGNMSQTPKVLEGLLKTGRGTAPEVAPTGVELIKLKAKVITLRDSTRIIQIHGRLFNTTLDAFKDITLEAKVFDESNKELAQLEVPADHVLRRTRDVSAFSADDLEEQQQIPNPLERKQLLLRPSKKEVIRIFFTDPEVVAKAAWFSTRVYSVVRPEA